jgi:glc operon protein GlcG
MPGLKLPRRRGRFPLATPTAGVFLIWVGMVGAIDARDLPTRHVLTLEATRNVAEAAEQLAEQKGWPCVIAIVDSAGNLIFLERTDASPMLASAELVPKKARTAALFAKRTKALEGTIRAGRLAATTAGFVEMATGQPLLIDGEVFGAVGISSAQPDWDATLADAGAQSLSDQSQSQKANVD